jgi:hypothetical protein
MEPDNLNQLRLQQLLQPFNNQTGVMNTNSAIPMINSIPMINTGMIDQNLRNTDLVQQIIAENQMKANVFSRPNMMNVAGTSLPGGITEIENQMIKENMAPLQQFQFLPEAYGQSEIDDTQDQEYIDQVKKSKGDGIGGLFRFLLGLAVPGSGLFMGDTSALQGIRNLNQRLRNTDFGQSRTLAEYAMKRRERKQAERAQEAMPEVYRSAKEQGFTNDRGGFSTNRADRAGTSVGSGQFSPSTSRGRSGY